MIVWEERGKPGGIIHADKNVEIRLIKPTTLHRKNANIEFLSKLGHQFYPHHVVQELIHELTVMPLWEEKRDPNPAS